LKTSTLSEAEIEKIIDELENQNENLRLANKRAEEAARRFSALFDLAPIAYFSLTPDGIVTELNYSGAGIFKAERSELINKNFSQLVSGDSRFRFSELLQKTFATGEKQSCEVQLNSTTNQNLTVYLECICFSDNDNCLLSAVDITQQKQSDEQIRKQFFLIKGISESLSSPVFSVDTNFCYTSFNRAYVSVMATLYGAEIEVGKNVLDYITEVENRNIAKKGLERAFRGEYHSEDLIIGDTHLVRKYFEIIYSPITDDIGDVIGATVLAMDISDRKQVELALKQSEQQYRYMFSEMLEGFALHEIILDDKGKPVDYRFLDINPAFERLTGFKKADTVGKTILEILPKTEAHWIKKYGKVALTGKSATFDNYSAELDRHYRVVAFRTQPGQFAVLFSDITDQLRSETALRISEEKFNKAFQNSPNAILITSLATGEIVDVNDSIFRIAGYTKAELIGKSTLELNLWKNLHEREAFRNILKKSARVLNFEADFQKKSGEIFTGLISGEFIELQGSKYVLSVVHDISERKKIEHDLLVSEGKWRSLVNTIPDFVALYDQDDNYIFLNHFAEGFSQKDIEGRHYSAFLPQESLPIYKQAFDKARKTRATQSIEYTGLGDFNALKIYESDVVPIFEGDKFVNMMVIARDITERKQAENALRESERQLATLISNLPGFVYRCKNDTLWSMLYMSDGCRAITGYEPEDFIANKKLAFRDIIHPDYVHPIWEKWQMLIKERKVFTEEYPIIMADGETRWVWEQGQGIFSDKDELLYLEGFITDITEQKLVKDVIKNSEARLLELNATKDKFFSIIAHDLKSPFNNIVVLSNLLVEQIQNNENEGIGEYAGLIQTSSQQAMSLLVNLLDWSRTQTGRLVCSPEYVDIVSLIHEVLESLNETARQKSINLELELPRNLLAYADKAMLSTVIRNLVSNALKFTNPGGLVVVKAKRSQTEFKITVSDNGVGIRPDDIKKLFRIEESISTKGTRNEKGTGLGLILCNEFVEKHGGAMHVRSEPGKGSSFSFTIPNFNTLSK
jgi:PAS domain S-box-containing protein